MKLRVMVVVVVLAVLFLSTGILYAANGDLIVNGNLGVGTTTPQGKAEVNGNMVVDGDTTMKGNTTTNGNTIVNGNLGVGTTTPQFKLDVTGDISFVKDGMRFVLKYVNFDEDIYSGYTVGAAADTCNGDQTNKYTCLPNDNRSCTDTYIYCAGACGLVYRSVTCKARMVFEAQ